MINKEAEMKTKTKAPDFNPGYPSGGETIGPAWQAAWDLLGTCQRPLDAGSIAAVVQAQVDQEVKADTVKNLLLAAARAGLVVKGTTTIRSREHNTYVRNPDVVS